MKLPVRFTTAKVGDDLQVRATVKVNGKSLWVQAPSEKQALAALEEKVSEHLSRREFRDGYPKTIEHNFKAITA